MEPDEGKVLDWETVEKLLRVVVLLVLDMIVVSSEAVVEELLALEV